MKSLKEIIEEIQSLHEGLIVTHPLDTSLDFLETWCNFNGKIKFIKIEKSKFKAIIKGGITDHEFDVLLKYTNNLGYFPSHIYSLSDEIGRKYMFNDAESLIFKNISFILKFEASFDTVLENDKFKLLYHVTDLKHEDKILKLGLCPKAKCKMSSHPDRIYLTFEGKDAYLFAYSPGSQIVNPILFEVDLNKSQISIKLCTDVNFQNKGCYTCDNIHPRCLKIVE